MIHVIVFLDRCGESLHRWEPYCWGKSRGLCSTLHKHDCSAPASWEVKLNWRAVNLILKIDFFMCLNVCFSCEGMRLQWSFVNIYWNHVPWTVSCWNPLLLYIWKQISTTKLGQCGLLHLKKIFRMQRFFIIRANSSSHR